MPILLQSSEKSGFGATVKLDNRDVVHLDVTRVSVTVRQWDLSGLVATITSRFFGPKLYREIGRDNYARTAEALSLMYPQTTPGLPDFKNVVLAVFVNAICHCRSAAEVRAMLNEAASRELE
jgi:hypothetical protein